MSERKVIVLGLDCATPQLVFDRWAHELPALSWLMQNGVYGPLKSCIPPITIPAWLSMMTGKDPGQLGCYGFRNRSDYSYQGLSFATSKMVTAATVWDILGREQKQVILLGRGGQGAVTSSQVLAIAAFKDGKSSQAFPNFGVERTGAPVRSYCRIDSKPINLREQVYEADYAIVLDATLLSGLVENVTGTIIINSNKKPEDLKLDTKAKVKCVDVTGVAIRVIGKPFVNIASLGAFAAISGEVSIDALVKAIEEKMGSKGSAVEKNIAAVKEVYALAKKCGHESGKCAAKK